MQLVLGGSQSLGEELAGVGHKLDAAVGPKRPVTDSPTPRGGADVFGVVRVSRTRRFGLRR